MIKIISATVFFGDRRYFDIFISDIDTFEGKLVICIFAAWLYLAFLAVHYYIGINAIEYGRGKSKKRVFLIWAFLLGTMTLAGLPGYFDRSVSDTIEDTGYAAVFMDVTFVLILFDMIFSVIRIHMLKEKTGEDGD